MLLEYVFMSLRHEHPDIGNTVLIPCDRNSSSSIYQILELLSPTMQPGMYNVHGCLEIQA